MHTAVDVGLVAGTPSPFNSRFPDFRFRVRLGGRVQIRVRGQRLSLLTYFPILVLVGSKAQRLFTTTPILLPAPQGLLVPDPKSRRLLRYGRIIVGICLTATVLTVL